MRILGGRSTHHQLGSVKARGMLEALREDGFVIPNDEGPAFIPRSAVLRMEQHEPKV
jgi:hypothetical protein